jgi:hypothetical protein
MDVIAHEDIRVHIQPVHGGQLVQQFAIEDVVFGIDKSRSAIDAALRDVKRDSSDELSWTTRNAGKSTATGNPASTVPGQPSCTNRRCFESEMPAIQSNNSSVPIYSSRLLPENALLLSNAGVSYGSAVNGMSLSLSSESGDSSSPGSSLSDSCNAFFPFAPAPTKRRARATTDWGESFSRFFALL